MLVAVPAALSGNELAEVRRLVLSGAWEDGRATAGKQSELAKRNLQLKAECPDAQAAGEIILAALANNGLFMSAALPKRVFPPFFNRYDADSGHGFDNHVDNAIRYLPDRSDRIRTDLSATLFLSDPDSYDGGELVIEDTYGEHAVKLSAGDLVLYPSASLHRVEPVTRGSRVASFFWIQSMVRDDGQRTLLLEMDAAIRTLATNLGDKDPAIVSLTGTYHNLLRRWADC
ncbi:Fe2+-dependent dioxygenase [Sphingomonas sp. SM33]|uniref:Fe2+-dependent dioxygenase n=1 Tax=Sphingomonas telluris TaxID=2907998 RepID=A0ABS9VN39_9SPHN|nr:Fe2+-dependent dioxygenase [Sphingomonas telluris]MCH8616391.1 Fe2+-dependent dioxygenase [Sphingomonas telluris]